NARASASRSGCGNFRISGHIDAKLNWPNLTANFSATVIYGVNVHVGLAGEQVSHILRAQSDASRNRTVGAGRTIEWNEHSCSDSGVRRAMDVHGCPGRAETGIVDSVKQAASDKRQRCSRTSIARHGWNFRSAVHGDPHMQWNNLAADFTAGIGR